jgi:hypothetical protein
MGWQRQFQDEFAGGVGDAGTPEPHTVIDAPGAKIIGRHQQPHPVAMGNAR